MLYWATSVPSSSVGTLIWAPGRVMRLRVPDDAPVGPGELKISGVLLSGVRRCDGASSCTASVTVNASIAVEISQRP